MIVQLDLQSLLPLERVGDDTRTVVGSGPLTPALSHREREKLCRWRI